MPRHSRVATERDPDVRLTRWRHGDHLSSAKAARLAPGPKDGHVHAEVAVIAPMPKSVGRYQILDRLAVGGMAELFKATLTGEHGFEKLVAIKKILPHLATDRSFVEMF